MTKQELLEGMTTLFHDIDHCILQLIQGRLEADGNKSKMAIWEMESLLANTQQMLSVAIDFINEADCVYEETFDKSEEYYLHFSIKAIDENNNTIDCDGLTCIKSSDGCSIEVLTDKIKETIEEKYNCVLKSVGIVSLNEISKGLYQILNNKEEHPHFDYYKLDGEEEEVEIGNEEKPNLSPDHCRYEETNLAGRTIRIPHKCDFCPNETANCKKIYIYGDSEAVCVV